MTSMTRMATISIDLDDLWAYRRSFGMAPDAGSLLALAVPRFVDLMAARGLHGTVFVIGRDAEQARHAPLLRQLSAAGHEIGNHSWDHAGDIDSWPSAAQQTDLARAHAAIEAATGQAPHGFRGPGFRVSASLLQTVQQLGYHYDTSVFPNALAALARQWQARRARALGTVAAPAAGAHGGGARRRLALTPWSWTLADGPLVEVPITTLPGLRLPLHGTYLQHLADRAPLLARAYLRGALALCRAGRVAPHYLLHATDFVGCDDPVDVAFLPGMRRTWRAKVALLDWVLTQLSARFTPVTLAQYVRALGPAHALPQRNAQLLA